MNPIYTNPIIELRSGNALADLHRHLSTFTTCVGLLIHDDGEAIDCRQVIETLPVPCAGIAFVTDIRLRVHRRMAVEIGLSRHHSCPCRVFGDPVRARAWLEQRVCQ